MATIKKIDPTTFPKPAICEKTSRHLVIKWGEEVIADTKDAYWALETYHAPTYYLPPSSIKVPLTTNEHRRTHCEWKGHASYYDITNPKNPNETVKGKIWSYEEPTPGFKDVKSYLSFYPQAPWDCYVDGEKVESQPGDFYGGWITSDIERGAVKGTDGAWVPNGPSFPS